VVDLVGASLWHATRLQILALRKSRRLAALAAPLRVPAPLRAAPRLLLDAEAEHRHGT
jgi:hypothetical protein